MHRADRMMLEDRSIELEKIGLHWSGMTLYRFKKLQGFLLSELQQQAYYDELKIFLFPCTAGAVKGGDTFIYDYDVLPFLRHRFKDSSNSEKA